MDLAEEMAIADIYKVDVLSTMMAFWLIWDKLPATAISNCWHHTRRLGVWETSSSVEIKGSANTELEDHSALPNIINEAVPPRIELRSKTCSNPKMKTIGLR